MVIRPNNNKTVLVGLLLAGLIGCSPRKDQSGLQPKYDVKTGKLRQLTYDSNSNGKPDAVSYMKGSEIVRVELDRDEDGLVDRWEYYGTNRQLVKVGVSRSNNGKVDAWIFEGAKGSIDRIEISTRQDGKVNRTEFYEKGLLTRTEEDTDANGVVDKWETYRNGILSSAAFDLKGSGRPTRRLTYEPDGSLRGIETDTVGQPAVSHP
jgi:antitoxin component YwqK of YwqJK toxin-antitoxin module